MENYSAKAYYKKYKFISFHDYFTLNNTGIERNRSWKSLPLGFFDATFHEVSTALPPPFPDFPGEFMRQVHTDPPGIILRTLPRFPSRLTTVHAQFDFPHFSLKL